MHPLWYTKVLDSPLFLSFSFIVLVEVCLRAGVGVFLVRVTRGRISFSTFHILLANQDPTLINDTPKITKNAFFICHVACGENGTLQSVQGDGTMNDHEHDNDHSASHISEKTKNDSPASLGVVQPSGL